MVRLKEAVSYVAKLGIRQSGSSSKSSINGVDRRERGSNSAAIMWESIIPVVFPNKSKDFRSFSSNHSSVHLTESEVLRL